MKNTLVSVIIPIYNGEKTLERAVSSVLNQTIFSQVEIVLIDDGSKDKSLQLAKRIQKKNPNNVTLVINEKNLGIAKTQNKGLRVAKGQFIARLDQDDLFIDKKKLEKQSKALLNDPDLGLIGTWTKVINEDGPNFELIPPTTDEKIRKKLLMASMFVAPSVMFRKSLVNKIGYYLEDLRYGTEDFEYWLRIGTHAKLANLGDFCLKYHFHPTSYSNQNKVHAMREHLQIISRYKKDYPGFTKAYFKNYVQYNLLKISFLRKFYNYIVPRIAGKIYS